MACTNVECSSKRVVACGAISRGPPHRSWPRLHHQLHAIGNRPYYVDNQLSPLLACPVFTLLSSEPHQEDSTRPFHTLRPSELFDRTEVLSQDTTQLVATCPTFSSSSRRRTATSTSSLGACSSTTSLSNQSLAKPSRRSTQGMLLYEQQIVVQADNGAQ